ncbi:hypothetical protein Tco_0938281 [Tanacetum coccineum]|uniref:Uncharacterized protein n=1 Tax=Tanacetum coccineum TaxID=301880 RepID=A0ABQ5DJE4_9ASTR
MRNRINIHTVRDDTLLGTLKFVSKTEDYQKYRALIPEEMINQDIKDSKAYKTYLAFSTGKATPKKARKFKKVASPSKKLSPILEEEPAKKPKQAKKPVKKATTVPTVGVVIRDTPGVFVSKKKVPAKVDRGKGMDLLSDVALLKATQLKKALKKSNQETRKLHVSGLGDGVGSQPKVPDESQDKKTSTNEGTDSEDDDSNDDDSDDVTNNDDDDVDSDADGDNEATDSERTDSDEDENPNLNQNDDEEEEYEEEYVRTPDNYEFSDDDEEYEELYKDVNMRLKDSYEKVKDDAHVTLTAAHVTQKTKGPMQSSFVSSDFANQFLNLDNVPLVDNEVMSMMNVKEVSDYATPVIQSTITESLENVFLANFSSQPKSTYEAAVLLTEFELKNILLDKMHKGKSYRGG